MGRLCKNMGEFGSTIGGNSDVILHPCIQVLDRQSKIRLRPNKHIRKEECAGKSGGETIWKRVEI